MDRPERSATWWRVAGPALAVALAACAGGGGAPPAACGNGVIEAGEGCDDGDTSGADGCAATCREEAGWVCAGQPSACTPVCGNGQVQPGEGCDDGNARAGDGCSASCQPEPGAPAVVSCRTLAPLPDGICQAAAGTAGLLVTGTVLVPGTIYQGGQVLVDAAGEIACVGCDCEAGAASAARVTCPGGVVSPGLVNLRDHLTFTQNAPFTDDGQRWEHRHEWRLGLNGHRAIPVAGNASAAQVRWGELRQLLGGATAIAGAGGQAGLLRNLDVAGLDEGLGGGRVHLDAFPLGDSGGALLSGGCGYPAIASPAGWAAAPGAILGVGEGSSAAAHNELTCTTGSGVPGGADLTGPRVLFAKTVGAGAADLARLAASGTALVWSPRSNVALYGDTAPVAAADRLGVQVALGTDWLVTGSSSMLRELACADQWNGERLGGFFTDEQLWLMATRNAADAAGLLGRIGLLAPGRAGDLVIVDGRSRPPHRAVLEATPAGLSLVVRGGRALAGDEALVAALRPAAACDAVDVCGRAKRLCLQDEVGATYAGLQAAAGGAPPAFSCGAPANEPTCVPSRPASVSGSTVYTGAATPADRDGDGLPDAQDDCPAVFNPVRPMDGGQQADADGDGVGDACDPCPLEAGTGACAPVDPNDLDGDGITAAVDTCPDVPNPDQADRDLDGKGDACDACPAASNPGATGCPATVYDVKRGVWPLGVAARLSGLLVTGVASQGFFAQAKEGDAGWQGADFSGIWIQLAGAAVAPGDRVDVEGVPADFFGQLQLVPASAAGVTVVASLGEAPPAPVAVAPADVATGGARAGALEGVLVRVSGVGVTDVAPPLGPGDSAPSDEFVVGGALRVDDLLYLASPFPAVGTTYDSVTGVLAFRAGDSKLEPRGAGDLVGQAELVGFSGGAAFARVGVVAGPTIPFPQQVLLSRPASGDLFVAITSSDPAALSVPGGGVTVPAGQSSALVPVTALAASPAVILTAALGAATYRVTVGVLDGTEVPALAGLVPDALSVGPGGTAFLLVALDLPAAAPTAVAIVVDPPGALSCPASVTVPADALLAGVSCTAAGVEGAATVTATLGAVQRTAAVNVVAGTHLVINEVDYDQVGADAAEFVELYNPTGAPVSLAGLSLLLVNGAVPATVYATVPLGAAGALAPGGYLVVCTGAVSPAPGAAVLGFDGTPTPGALGDRIQNGAPDGVALVDTGSGALLDALSYEGSIASVDLGGLTGTVSLVEGLPAAVADGNAAPGALARLPDGVDTDAATADWQFTGTPTPGAANHP